MTPPDWLCDGLIERDTVTVLSGDTAAGKSLVADALTAAVLRGSTWLERSVVRGRVLYVDEENHVRVVRDRLRAFGVSNDERETLRYYLREGVALGQASWNAWLRTEAEQHRADLVVIDTATAASAVDVNDNSAVAALYRDALRPTAGTGAAVLLLHHERKTGDWGRGSASQAMMGARQWAGQADAHLALRAPHSLISEPVEAGRTRQRYALHLELPKVRDGLPDVPSRLVLVSERDEAGRLDWMRLEADEFGDPAEPSLVDRIVEAVDREMSNKAVAAAVDASEGSGAFKVALSQAVDAKRITKPRRGRYAPLGP